MTGLLGTCPETVAACPPRCMPIPMGLDGLAAAVLRAPRGCGRPASSTVGLTREAPGPRSSTSGPGTRPQVHRVPACRSGREVDPGPPAPHTLARAGLRRPGCPWAPVEGEAGHVLGLPAPGCGCWAAQASLPRRPEAALTRDLHGLCASVSVLVRALVLRICAAPMRTPQAQQGPGYPMLTAGRCCRAGYQSSSQRWGCCRGPSLSWGFSGLCSPEGSSC